MKIGVTCHPTYGGSGAVATELGLEMARAGHEVHFISYAQPFRLDGFREGVYFHEVEMEPYPLFENPPYSLALAVMIQDVAARHDLDLVHAHYAIPHATSAWIAREMFEDGGGPRLVTTLHGTDITLVGQHPSFKRITRFSILKSDGLTAVSHFLARETETNFGVDSDSIRVIPNFIDTDRYRPDREPCHRATLAPGGEKIVMHISNFRPVKRVEDVVTAFAGMVARTPARLVMVGDGPERARAQRAARRLGVEDDVVFPGKHAAVDELLSCADLFLLPSESESFGLAALEAMSCGVPVIATRVGGLPEVVVDGVTGYLVEVGDTDTMARLGAEILADQAMAKEMGDAARTRAVEAFSAPRVVPRYAEFYRQVLDAPPENGGSPRTAGVGPAAHIPGPGGTP
ncbi:MAG: N-acetyl-alpha-D-glucosaminyl L-malate synthase BshA [Gemmatimonadales bacterium]|nr:MAG: N-acetyl-alpha-D-glucosaminyl L-malate synthase BshA [Gemmatimonadales bacterium]